MSAIKPEWHNEDLLEAAAGAWLLRNDWTVTPRGTPSRPDIRAADANGRSWICEVKGFPATFQKRDGLPKSRNTIRTQRHTFAYDAVEDATLGRAGSEVAGAGAKSRRHRECRD